ncbi:demethylase [Croceivirga sp. JEA036]|uniref:demethylase n=1 Tax=Croceivirga sp. JEA036 TaxID=2721162 RepID=UPI001439D413|nr:demethylase [Croceivirga sp. JEA036]NJB38131.1 demethylase [Croceivirga sp. JEA036]
MANIHTNDKGFLIIKMTREEFLSIGGLSRCDGCNTPMNEGYYIAVLNYAYCEKDFHSWYQRAERFPEDASFERRNFNGMCQIMNIHSLN